MKAKITIEGFRDAPIVFTNASDKLCNKILELALQEVRE